MATKTIEQKMYNEVDQVRSTIAADRGSKPDKCFRSKVWLDTQSVCQSNLGLIGLELYELGGLEWEAGSWVELKGPER